jgi:hypothetical protein
MTDNKGDVSMMFREKQIEGKGSRDIYIQMSNPLSRQ